MAGNTPRPQNGVRRKRKKRTLIRAACEICRRRKLSCDGHRPNCSRCVQQGAECVYYTENTDETRDMARKREIEKLRASHDDISNSFNFLKQLPKDVAVSLLSDVTFANNPMLELVSIGRRIQAQERLLNTRISALETAKATFPNPRSTFEFELNVLHPLAYPTLISIDAIVPREPKNPNISLDSLIAKQQIHELSSPGGVSRSSTSEQSPSFTGFQLANHGNHPVNLSASLSYWTSVPISSELASRAITVYLMTDHALLGHFDSELFLADLVGCCPSYCSPLLVNSLLFYACLKLTKHEPEAPGLADRFYQRSTEIWKNDKTASSLSLSALGLLFAGASHSGKPEEAKGWLTAAITMGKELGVFGSKTQSGNEDDNSALSNNAKMLSYATWSLFAHTVFMAFRWWTIPPDPPNVPIPEEGDSLDTTMSQVFGLSHADAVRSQRTFVALCRVLLVIRDSVIGRYASLWSPSKAASLAFAESIYKRLVECNDADTMTLDTNHEVPDFVTIIRMWFHMAVMDLFQPFISRQDQLKGFSASESTAAALFAISLRQLQHLVLVYRFRSPLALTTPLWHGCIYLVARTVTTFRVSEESTAVFKICVMIYADLLVSFPGLMDVFRGLLLLGNHTGFLTAQESLKIGERVCNRINLLQAGRPGASVFAVAGLGLHEDFRDPVHPILNAGA